MVDPGFFSPDVQILLYGLVNSVIVWTGKKFGLDPLRLWAVVCVCVGAVYISTTLDPNNTNPLWMQLLVKSGLVVTVSAGIFKTVRMFSGQEQQSKEKLVQKGIDIANAQNQNTVTVIPVQSEAPVVVGTPVVVSQPPAAVGAEIQVVPAPVVPVDQPKDPESVGPDGISQSARLSGEHSLDPTQ